VRTLAAVRIFTSGKYHSLLGNFPSRIASNAENSPISQRGCTSLDSPKPTAEAVQENNQPLFHKLKKKGKPYMGFVVLHMEKAHGSDSGTTAHIERFIIPKNADPTRTHLNRKLIDYPDGVKDRTAAIQHRLENAGLTRKIGNNQVQAIRIIVSGTHEDMERIEKEGRLDEWCADNMSYFAFMFGKENIVAAHLHRDEETPHIHITLVPIVKGERKRRKREEQTKKRYRKKPTDTVRLCADDIMTRLKLKTYQDTYAIAMAKYGLQRGIDGSTARHKSTQQYYRDTQKLVDSLKAEVVDLQERKEAARQELRQAKKEVQTEKLKGAATTAATNIAESVGSFFGSNKVKTLERENKNLHERVSELQEEARQREQQQAKHIQEITDAYELRHRKLSEFTDFVKRYFPYVEKLIPTINFLRERLGFNDDIIRRLCTFKDVPIKGKLHSSEFNQGFETQRAVCSIKEDENGKFDFKIDGVSHISWFRKKMNEFREAIGIPKPRQNRGMQL
jgi:predicted  nucleic acid-binding Zn-ribbon protein